MSDDMVAAHSQATRDIHGEHAGTTNEAESHRNGGEEEEGDKAGSDRKRHHTTHLASRTASRIKRGPSDKEQGRAEAKPARTRREAGAGR